MKTIDKLVAIAGLSGLRKVSMMNDIGNFSIKDDYSDLDDERVKECIKNAYEEAKNFALLCEDFLEISDF